MARPEYRQLPREQRRLSHHSPRKLHKRFLNARSRRSHVQTNNAFAQTIQCSRKSAGLRTHAHHRPDSARRPGGCPRCGRVASTKTIYSHPPTTYPSKTNHPRHTQELSKILSPFSFTMHPGCYGQRGAAPPGLGATYESSEMQDNGDASGGISMQGNLLNRWTP